MTRAEILNDIIRITNQDYEAVRRMKAHDQSQREEIARLKNILCSVDKDHAIRKLNLEIARLREALEEANKQLISTAAGTDEFGGLLRRIRIALAKEATRDNAE